jgi:hypothetical protein
MDETTPDRLDLEPFRAVDEFGGKLTICVQDEYRVIATTESTRPLLVVCSIALDCEDVREAIRWLTAWLAAAEDVRSNP